MTTQPERIGPYRILELLGEGGMGAVYLAEQREPVRRRVALKLLKPGADTKQLLGRFAAERQALARMDHANVAAVLDSGMTDNGQPYFTMEHVPGEPITDYCSRHRVGVRGRLEIFLGVCCGVQHAHQKGLIHRDLKPANVLVNVVERTPVPKVIDFGIAKALEGVDQRGTLLTQEGQMLGTPEFMSPEQVRGQGIDARTDIYALGVLLYELVAGRRPFDAETLQEGGVFEMLRVIREVDPPRPSTRVSSVGDTTRIGDGDPRSLSRALRGDLDWIVMKMLAKEPERRYPSVAEVIADIRRYLAHEPVLARPPSTSYRLRKLVRRHPGRVAFVVLASLLLVAGILLNARNLIQEKRELTRATSFANREDQHRREAEARSAEIDRDTERFALLASVLDREAAQSDYAEIPLRPFSVGSIERVAAWLEERAEPAIAVRGQLDRLRDNLAQQRSQANGLAPLSQFLLETATSQLTQLDAFESDKGALARAKRWLAKARAARDRSIDRYETEWAEATRQIAASSRYAGLRLPAQIDLVPLGFDPESKLAEFAHVPSGEIPERAADGTLQFDDESGIVFVLIPGGSFLMGAQSEDKQRPNYDPEAEANESPVRKVDVVPFFLAKHELTIGQWARLSTGSVPCPSPDTTGEKRHPDQPGYARQLKLTWRHPVHLANWQMSTSLLREHGLDLPLETQWEYAARAGTTTRFWTGTARDSLNGAELVGPEPPQNYLDTGPPRDLTYMVPVDRLRANPFGLHHMLGNLAEWCREPYGDRHNPKIWERGGVSNSEMGRLRATRGSSGHASLRGGYIRATGTMNGKRRSWYQVPVAPAHFARASSRVGEGERTRGWITVRACRAVADS